jgi:hypothetical protein
MLIRVRHQRYEDNVPVANLTLFNTLLGPIRSDAEVAAAFTPNPQASTTSVPHAAGGGTGANWVFRRDDGWNDLYAYYGLNNQGKPEDEYFSSNFYDRANIGYYKYAMGGYSDETVLAAANHIAAYYRDWLASNGNYTSWHWQMPRGVALHFAATGQEASRTAIRGLADKNHWVGDAWAQVGRLWKDDVFLSFDSGLPDQRGNARMAESIRLAYLIGATSELGYNYRTDLDYWLNALLNRSGHYPDGSFRDTSRRKCTFVGPTRAEDTFDSTILYRCPFYTSLQLNEMIFHYRQISADPRIITAIGGALENFWTGTPTEPGLEPIWIPGPDTWNTQNCFGYVEAALPGPTVNGFPGQIEQVYHFGRAELNGMMMHSHAFMYKHTGLEIWKTRFLKLLDGMKYYDPSNWIFGAGKQYNENFTYSGGMWSDILSVPMANRALFDQILGAITPTATVAAYVNPNESPDHARWNGTLPAYKDGDGAGWVARRDAGYAAIVAEYGTASSGIGGITGQAFDPGTLNNFTNHYDRAHLAYLKFAMDGYSDESVLNTANAWAVIHRDYLTTNGPLNGGPQPAFTNPRGIALHYAVTGDPVSKNALGKHLNHWYNGTYISQIGYLVNNGTPVTAANNAWDLRVNARVGELLRMCLMVGLVGNENTDWFGGVHNHDYAAEAALWLTRMLTRTAPGGLRNADGSFRAGDSMKVTGSPGSYVYHIDTIFRKNWEIGLLMNEFIEHYRIINQSTDIIEVVQNAMENLFTGPPTDGAEPNWITTPDTYLNVNHFPEIEATDPPSMVSYNDGPPQTVYYYGEPRFNGFYAAPLAWLYQRTGNATWKTRFNLILDGHKQYNARTGQPIDWLGGLGKDFNQAFSFWASGTWPNAMGSSTPVNPKKMRGTW